MIFNAEELAGLAVAPGDRAAAALDVGDTAAARQVATDSINVYFPIRDIYTAWNAMTLAYVARELSDGSAEACLRSALRPVLRPVVEWFRNGVTREAVAQLAQLLRMDCGELAEAFEDEYRVVLTGKEWAGSRVQAMDIPGLPLISAVTSTVERLAAEWLGYPPFVIDHDERTATVTVTVEKDPTRVSGEVYRRLGIEPDRERISAAFSVAGAQLFDDAELEGMRHQAFDRALVAMDASDEVRARRHFAFSKVEWYLAHHLLRDLVTAMLSWLHDEHGVSRTWDCVEVAYNRPIMGQMVAQVSALELREQVQMLGTLFHQHGMKFDIVEDEGGFDFRTRPCGSGGRLIEEGAYTSPKSFATVEGPGLTSFGLDEMPVYCMHCPATNRMFLEEGGPYFLLVEPDVQEGRIRGHCSFHIFKNAAAAPDTMYTRVELPVPTVGRPA